VEHTNSAYAERFVASLNDIDWSEKVLKKVKETGLGNQLVHRAYPLTPQEWDLSLDYMTISNTNTIGRKCGRVTNYQKPCCGMLV
jgi:hypothetical protein